MFSTGQKIFGLIFAIAFILIIIWSYRKDLKLHQLYYKKVWIVGISIIFVIGLFAILTFILHK